MKPNKAQDIGGMKPWNGHAVVGLSEMTLCGIPGESKFSTFDPAEQGACPECARLAREGGDSFQPPKLSIAGSVSKPTSPKGGGQPSNGGHQDSRFIPDWYDD